MSNINHDTAINLIKDLVRYNTTPGKPTLPLIDYVETYLGRYGLSAQKKIIAKKQDAVLVARIGPEAPGGIVLSGHVDVVPVAEQTWQTDPFNLHNDGQRLYGRGVCDMKGFIGCVLAMVSVWQRRSLTRPFYLALSCDEEQSNKTVQDVIALLRAESFPPAHVIVGEPTSMEPVAAHKGTLCYELDIVGKEAHSSRPDLGINALLVAHDIVTFVRNLEDEYKQTTHDDSFFPPYATTNLGKIDGGTAANIVPGRCFMAWHMRPILKAQADGTRRRVEAFLDDLRTTKYPGVEIICRESSLVPLEPRQDNPALALAQRALGRTRSTTAPYATEAGCFQQANFSTVVCGPGSIEQAHAPDEYLELTQIEACLTFLNALSA